MSRIDIRNIFNYNFFNNKYFAWFSTSLSRAMINFSQIQLLAPKGPIISLPRLIKNRHQSIYS